MASWRRSAPIRRRIRPRGGAAPEKTYASQTFFADYENDKVQKFHEPTEMTLDTSFGLVTYK